MASHATVDEYIEALPDELLAVAEAARRVIDARLEGAESAIKWAHPTWSLGKQPVCYLKGASKHVTVRLLARRLHRRSVRAARDVGLRDGAREASLAKRCRRGTVRGLAPPGARARARCGRLVTLPAHRGLDETRSPTPGFGNRLREPVRDGRASALDRHSVARALSRAVP